MNIKHMVMYTHTAGAAGLPGANLIEEEFVQAQDAWRRQTTPKGPKAGRTLWGKPKQEHEAVAEAERLVKLGHTDVYVCEVKPVLKFEQQNVLKTPVVFTNDQTPSEA